MRGFFSERARPLFSQKRQSLYTGMQRKNPCEDRFFPGLDAEMRALKLRLHGLPAKNRGRKAPRGGEARIRPRA